MPNTVPEGALWVVAAAIMDTRQRVLISQRAAQVDQGGLWEFPGGKVEPGELAVQALIRELDEELGLRPRVWRPLITVPFIKKPQRLLWLQVFKVTVWDGEPEGREAQPLAWVPVESLGQREFPEANRPVIAALQLPEYLQITPELAEDCCSWVPPQMAKAWLLLRQPLWSKLAYRQWVERCCTFLDPKQIVLHNRADLVEKMGVAGVHYSAAQYSVLKRRPVPVEFRFGGSAHCTQDLRCLQELGADYATVSPVLPTCSHPGRAGMGWERFAAMVADTSLPVYALGGMSCNDLTSAWLHGAQGIAGIRGLYDGAAEQVNF